jgi:phosphohistidine swiveling domain-containing protein
MEKEIKPEDYICSYASDGAQFSFQDVVSSYYMPPDSINTCVEGKITSYFHISRVKKMQQEGLRMSERDIETHSHTLENLVEEALGYRKILQTIKLLDKDETKKILSPLWEISREYFFFDMMFWDKVFEDSVSNPISKSKVEKIQSLKNKLRADFENVYFTEESTQQLLLKKLAAQFNITYKEIEWYREAELFSLFDGKKVVQEELDKRKVAYVHIKDDRGELSFFVGSKALQIAQALLPKVVHTRELRGKTAHRTGKVIQGHVRVIIRDYQNRELLAHQMKEMKEGEILVSPTTDPEMMEAIRKSAAMITDIGGMLSHTAIVAREFNIPCIVDAKVATKVLKTGMMVEVDADKGVIKILT